MRRHVNDNFEFYKFVMTLILIVCYVIKYILLFHHYLLIYISSGCHFYNFYKYTFSLLTQFDPTIDSSVNNQWKQSTMMIGGLYLTLTTASLTEQRKSVSSPLIGGFLHPTKEATLLSWRLQSPKKGLTYEKCFVRPQNK